MNDWDVDEDYLEQLAEARDELNEKILAEKNRVPSEKQWAAMTTKERREWAKKASPQQRAKIQYGSISDYQKKQSPTHWIGERE